MKMCKKEIPGLYRIVTRKDAPTAKDAVSYIDKFFKVDTDCELVFSRLEDFTIIDFEAIKEYVTSKGLDHICDDVHHMTVFMRRTPQYWRDKILASGKMYNHKYFIHPPTSQSSGKGLNPLLQQPVSAVPQPNVLEKSGVQQNKKVPGPTEEEKRQCLERIKDIHEKYTGRKARKKKTRRQQYMRSISDEKVRMGIPLIEIHELRFVGKKRRKKAQRMKEELAKMYASRRN
ncbi:uncharacterized protein LOC124372327 isoform X1 [Homalodisca vitripennis]|uniref:uncharacterized protein LOC124372327 isoform X1 n=1 Tax=Homalodisca vitripennis TaxID=197043 RepID=UPI001EEB3E0A|nr:uncharacterized protein LOC124372327 isoform X1 [Homalodisca vitripennis]